MTGDGKFPIDAALARDLVATQFPHWADLPITTVPWSGWDNRTFRLGDTMSVRLPSAAGYAAQVEKEQYWLPRLAPHLPLPIPVPLAQGKPAATYPWSWSIYRWLEGDVIDHDHIADRRACAVELAHFLRALQRIDPTGGPPAGIHNFFRGGPLATYDAETRQAITQLENGIDAATALAAWEAALAAEWRGPPVWVHGDVAVGNLLARDGRLAAVIDFGCTAIGDPACDLVIAWLFFEGPNREAFRDTIGLDPATWARARGWALWKALITIAGNGRNHPAETPPRRVLDTILAEYRATK